MKEHLTQRMEVMRGDITKLAVDAIVNAANERLAPGGGVDGAIRRAAGPELNEACRKLRGCPTGGARITPGFRLPAAYVIHTVGPIWRGGQYGEAQLLRSCYLNSLRLAEANNIKSIAFPCISTGIYGYPKADACAIAVGVVKNWLHAHELPERVIFCCFDEEDYRLYTERLSDIRNG